MIEFGLHAPLLLLGAAVGGIGLRQIEEQRRGPQILARLHQCDARDHREQHAGDRRDQKPARLERLDQIGCLDRHSPNSLEKLTRVERLAIQWHSLARPRRGAVRHQHEELWRQGIRELQLAGHAVFTQRRSDQSDRPIDCRRAAQFLAEQVRARRGHPLESEHRRVRREHARQCDHPAQRTRLAESAREDRVDVRGQIAPFGECFGKPLLRISERDAIAPCSLRRERGMHPEQPRMIR